MALIASIEGSRPVATAEPSLLGFAATVLRHRRLIIGLGFAGGLLGLTLGLVSRRQYRSVATFIPQSSDSPLPSGLMAAASQFGVRLPTASSAWTPSVYVELLQSRDVLAPLATDTVVVAEEGGRRVALLDLLKINGPTPRMRVDRAVKQLRVIITPKEDLKLGAVTLSVITPWPSVSLTLAQRAIAAVNRFNLVTRKSEATAERQFAEAQAAEAQTALRDAEDKLEYFLQTNRSISGSESLTLQRQRIEREVSLRQQVYTTLVQSREDARLREVRDTPVITVIEAPALPVIGESRHTVERALLGGIAGGLLGLLIAFLSRGLSAARATADPSARDFFQLLDEVTPRFLKQRGA